MDDGHILGCGTVGDGDHTKSNSNGMIKSHAYAILGTVEIKDKKGKNFRLVKIRNPWAKDTYTGLANDFDKEFWTPYMKK